MAKGGTFGRITTGYEKILVGGGRLTALDPCPWALLVAMIGLSPQRLFGTSQPAPLRVFKKCKNGPSSKHVTWDNIFMENESKVVHEK